jgi:nucleoside-diphosphate-sugar epimerase
MTDRLFLTGGSGFIGSYIIAIALEHGFAVRNFDIAAPQRAEHTPYWVEGDVRDLPAMKAAVDEFAPTHFMHLASDIDVSITQLEQFTTTIAGTANVLKIVADLPLKRFLHTATQFVVKPGVEPETERFHDPYTVYGEAKAETETLVWEANLPMPWVIVRPVIVWGPGHPSFADNIFKHLASRNYLHPTGQPIMRAFGYVETVAQQMFALVTMPVGQSNRQVFYVGDETLDYDQWADAFSLALTGKKARRIPAWLLKAMGKVGDVFKAVGLPAPIDSGRAFRMTTSSRIDLTPTHATTGIGPKADFDAGVRDTVAWLRKVDPVRFAPPRA